MSIAAYVTQGIGPDSSIAQFITLGFSESGSQVIGVTVAGLPQRGIAYDFPPVSLVDVSISNTFLIDPTISSGDFQISKNRGLLANLETLPVISPTGSSLLQVSLSATEMTADKIAIVGISSNGSWADVTLVIDVPEILIDDVYDLLVGDHVETSQTLVINLKDTTTALLSKTITGSLLSDNITIRTVES